MTVGIQVKGLEQVEKLFKDLAPRHVRNINRATIHGIASEGVKIARRELRSKGIDRTGNLRRSIKAKRMKSHPDRPRSKIYFAQGKEAKHDGFYWRFIEYGFRHVRGGRFIAERPFIRPTREQIRANFDRFYIPTLRKKYIAAIKREQKKLRKGARR